MFFSRPDDGFKNLANGNFSFRHEVFEEWSLMNKSAMFGFYCEEGK